MKRRLHQGDVADQLRLPAAESYVSSAPAAPCLYSRSAIEQLVGNR